MCGDAASTSSPQAPFFENADQAQAFYFSKVLRSGCFGTSEIASDIRRSICRVPPTRRVAVAPLLGILPMTRGLFRSSLNQP
jgi:hypothetical protein